MNKRESNTYFWRLFDFVFYTIVRLFSLLPLSFLYFLAKVFMLIAYNLFGYRKEVVFGNLQKSFPEKSAEEIVQIANAFYTHLGQVFAESFKGFTIGKKNLRKRYKMVNPELVENMYKQGKSILLVSGHYNNWEFFVQSLNIQFSYMGVGVGKHITSHGFSELVNKARTRFGMTIWDHLTVRDNMQHKIDAGELFACMLLSDQSPSNYQQSYWMKFLNQDTPVLYGPEYFAKKYDLPVFYYEVIKRKIGYYEVTFIPVSVDSKNTAYGEITYKHNKLLEQTIIKNPAQWLWSHKRWKHSHHASKFEVHE